MTPGEDSGFWFLNQMYAAVKPYLVSVIRYCEGEVENGAMGVLMDLGGPILATNFHVVERVTHDSRYTLHPVLKGPSTGLQLFSAHRGLDLATLRSAEMTPEMIERYGEGGLLDLPSGGITADQIRQPEIGKPIYAAGFPNCTRDIIDDGTGPKQSFKIVSVVYSIIDYSDGVITLDRSKATGNADPNFLGMSGSPLWQIEPFESGFHLHLVGLLKGTPDPDGPYVVGNSFRDLEATGRWKYERIA